jgi:hypothetical protein
VTYCVGQRDLAKLRNLPKATQLASSRARILAQLCLTTKPGLLPVLQVPIHKRKRSEATTDDVPSKLGARRWIIYQGNRNRLIKVIVQAIKETSTLLHLARV